VDEAHMLTREAWNALLKILEEPPPRVVFVFATTEPQKIAQAAAPVLSRLQRFDFKRIGPAEIRARLEHVLKAEKITAEPEGIGMIARAADGSMRDALSLTDQVLAMGEGTLTASRVRDALGLVPEDEYIALLDAIAEHRAQDIFPFVARLADAGVDFGQFLVGVGEILRAQLSVTLGGDAPGVSDQARAALVARKGQLDHTDLLRMLNALGEIEIRFKRSSQQQLLVETLLVRFALQDRSVAIEDVLQAIGGGDKGGDYGAPAAERSRTQPAKVTSAPRGVTSSLARDVVSESRPAVVADVNALTARWDELIARVRGSGKVLLAAALEASAPASITAAGELTIVLDEPNDFHERALDSAKADILAVLTEWFAGVSRLTVRGEQKRGATPAPPKRVTDEMVKTERLSALRKQNPGLGAAIDTLDLDIVE